MRSKTGIISRMARPREFDIEKALTQAMLVFWEQSYLATSMEDLMKATGLNKQSLYCAFGNKHSLFVKALRLYRRQDLPEIQKILNQTNSPLEVIEAILRYAVDRAAVQDCPQGCLMANTALEFGSNDPEVANEVKKMRRVFEKLLAGVIHKGQQRGEITSRFDSEVIAQSLWNTLSGIRILEKTGASKKQIHAIVDMALDAIKA
jgi:TetR/AcrR family transcriptional repressor of nem operon